MKSLSEIIAWLKTPEKLPVILVEIPGIVVPGNLTMYLSSTPFSSDPLDPVLPNIVYDASIVGGINFTESISMTGGVAINYGDIELDNTDGSKDSWLYNYIWVNKDIQILIGDATWLRNDFRPIFNGTIVDITSRSTNTLNIVIADKLQKLNNPISGTSTDADSSSLDTLKKPITFCKLGLGFIAGNLVKIHNLVSVVLGIVYSNG